MLKRFSMIGLIMVMLLSGFSSPAVAAEVNDEAQKSVGPQTFTVTVGYEDVARGAMVNAFFPASLKIHTGDTVNWIQNTHEIHTVTFLAGAPMPDLIIPAPANPVGPLMINPLAAFPAAPADGKYDGSTYANSGIMSTDPGQPTQFSLTFTKAGTYEYVCLVHGMMMSGKVIVEDSSVRIPSPNQVKAEAKHELNRYKNQIPEVIEAARRMVKPPVKNPDGSKTYTVFLGYAKGAIDLASFFPKNLVVHPGDTVNWVLSPSNMAPHTVTFLNGTPDQGLVVPFVPPSGPPPLLIFNPAILFPSNAGVPLMPTGYINSGLLDPTQPGPHSFSLQIGNFTGPITYQCLLHDASGMVGKLIVVAKK
jgi:plastocyanin